MEQIRVSGNENENSADEINKEFRLLCDHLKKNVSNDELFTGLVNLNTALNDWGSCWGVPKQVNDYMMYYIFSMVKIGNSSVLLNEKCNELRDLQAKYDALNRKFGALDYANKTLTAENERLKKYEDSYREMKYSKESIQKENEKLGQANLKLILENNKFKSENDNLKQQNQIFVTQNDALKSENDNLKQQNQIFVTQNDTLKSENENLTYQNQVFAIQNDALKLDNETSQKNFDNVMKMYDLMCETYKSCSKNSEQIKKQLENKCNTYMEQIENWKNACIDQAEQIKQLEKSKRYELDDLARENGLQTRRNNTEITKKRVIKQIERYLYEYYSRHNGVHLKRIPINDIARLSDCCIKNIRLYVKEIGENYKEIIGENHKCYQVWYDSGHKFTGERNMKKVKIQK